MYGNMPLNNRRLTPHYGTHPFGSPSSMLWNQTGHLIINYCCQRSHRYFWIKFSLLINSKQTLRQLVGILKGYRATPL